MTKFNLGFQTKNVVPLSGLTTINNETIKDFAHEIGIFKVKESKARYYAQKARKDGMYTAKTILSKILASIPKEDRNTNILRLLKIRNDDNNHLAFETLIYSSLSNGKEEGLGKGSTKKFYAGIGNCPFHEEILCDRLDMAEDEIQTTITELNMWLEKFGIICEYVPSAQGGYFNLAFTDMSE